MPLVTEESILDLTRRAHILFSNGDAEALAEICDPDVEFGTFIGQMEGRVYRGHDGVREWVANVHETFDHYGTEIVEMKALGDDAVLVEVRLFARASGLELEEVVFQIAEMRDGRAFRWTWHRTREEALAARGKPL